MKASIAVLVFSQFLATIVGAVFLEDAFVKDWVIHNYGTLEKYNLLGENSILGLSASGELVKLDADLGVIKYLIDFTSLRLEEYAIVGSFLLAYSRSEVFLWDKETGILLNSLELTSPVVHHEPLFDEGVLILDGSGNLQVLKAGSTETIGNYKATSFAVSRHQGLQYVIIDSLLFSLTRSLESANLGTLNVQGQIVDFKENLLLSTKKAYIIGEQITEIPASFLLPQIIDLTHIVDLHKNEVSIYTLMHSRFDKTYLEEITKGTEIDILEFSLSTFLAVISPESTQIRDITDFVLSNDVNSITSFELPSNGKELLTHRVGSETFVSLLSVIGSFLVIESSSTTGIRKTQSLPLAMYRPGHKALLVDKPLSLSTINKVHHLVEESQSASVLYRWLMRTKDHLVQLGRLGYDFATIKKSKDSVIAEDQYGFEKIFVFFDEDKSFLVAKDSSNGLLLWATPITAAGRFIDLAVFNADVIVAFENSIVTVNLRDGVVLLVNQQTTNIEDVLLLMCEISEEEAEEGYEPKIAAFKLGSSLTLLNSGHPIASAQYLISVKDNSLIGYKIVGLELLATWTFSRPDAKILAVEKTSEIITSALGISKADRSVLYKYLNPNLVSVITEESGVLKLTLIEGITGNILHTQEHEGETIDFLSVSIVQSDNWVVYSYFVTYPKVEQRVVAVDLFTTEDAAIGEPVSVFSTAHKSRIPKVSTKSFIFPEKIVSLASTATKFGITVKSIIALTDTGNLIEIPKFMLNSRRIDDRKMTLEDFGEFRLSPYEAVIMKNNYQVLNHKNKLRLGKGQQQILVKPTELESTAVVCLVNEHNQFCTTVQPSLSYDLLSGNFQKINLCITIVVLLVGLLVTKPFVYSRKLNAKWID